MPSQFFSRRVNTFCLSALLVVHVSSALTVNNGDPFSPPERPVVNNDVDSNMLDLVKKLRDDVFANPKQQVAQPLEVMPHVPENQRVSENITTTVAAGVAKTIYKVENKTVTQARKKLNTTVNNPHRFLRVRTLSKLSQRAMHENKRSSVAQSQELRANNQGGPAMKKVFSLANAASQIGMGYPHELINTENFQEDVEEPAGGSTYSPACESLNGKFDMLCGSVTAGHNIMNCRRLTHQIMQMCWMSEQRGLPPLGMGV